MHAICVCCCCRIDPCELAETVGRLTTLVKLDLPEYTLDGGKPGARTLPQGYHSCVSVSMHFICLIAHESGPVSASCQAAHHTP